MALNLKNTLVIGISATALFDLSESDQLFKEEFKKDPDHAIEKYRSYMLENDNIPLNEGIGFRLIKALLNLNRY